MRLLRVELTRFRLRRAVVLTLLAGLLAALAVVAGVAWDSRPPSAAEVTAAQQQVEADRQGLERELARCQRNPERYLGPGATADGCVQQQPQLEWYLPRRPLDLEEQRRGTGSALVVLLAGLAIIAGATFAGGDWASGSMSNQLLFVPRRARVWVAKAVAVVLGVTVAAALVLAAFWAGMAVVASVRDVAVPDRLPGQVLEQGLRGLALVAGAGLGGYALTMLFRHTVGTLAVLFAYTVAGEALFASLPVERAQQWSLSSNVLAWVRGQVRLFDDRVCGVPTSPCDPYFTVTDGRAALYLGVLLALAVVVSLVAFRRRDVP